MVLASPWEPLSQLEVLAVDCQATAAAPRGHLLEIGWARVLGSTITHVHASLIALPDGEQIPPAVGRITGISQHMMRAAVDGRCAWRELTSVVWREPVDSCSRLIVIENSEVVSSGAVDANATPPIPPGHRRPVAARREAFTLASFDRLRVLTTELKRLVAAGAPVALRLGVGPALDESRLASALWWV
jgi:hypothetical protein